MSYANVWVNGVVSKNSQAVFSSGFPVIITQQTTESFAAAKVTFDREH